MGEEPEAAADPSVRVTVRMIRGQYKMPSADILFHGELLIGNSQDCDIILDDDSIAPKNTKVFAKDGCIYIWDMNEISNTYLEGMKIFTPNRLRSGDEITIGNTVFKLLF